MRGAISETSSAVKRRTSLILKNWLRALCSSGVPAERLFPRGPGSKKIDVPTSTAQSTTDCSKLGDRSSKPYPLQNKTFEFLIANFASLEIVLSQLNAGSLQKSARLVVK